MEELKRATIIVDRYSYMGDWQKPDPIPFADQEIMLGPDAVMGKNNTAADESARLKL
jgi:hypothetical protein